MRSAQPETTQASQVDVPLGGLPLPVVALALRIRRDEEPSTHKAADCDCLIAVQEIPT